MLKFDFVTFDLDNYFDKVEFCCPKLMTMCRVHAPLGQAILFFIFCVYILIVDGDAVVLLTGHLTCDLQVVGSSPGWASLRSGYKLLTPVCLCHQAV